MKRLALLSILLPGLVLVVGCGKPGASGGDEGTVGATGATSDTSTVTAIQDKIKADKDLDGANIKVTSQNGTIALDGTVSKIEQKDKAEQIVRDTQKEKKQQPGVEDRLLVQTGGAAGGGAGGGH